MAGRPENAEQDNRGKSCGEGWVRPGDGGRPRRYGEISHRFGGRGVREIARPTGSEAGREEGRSSVAREEGCKEVCGEEVSGQKASGEEVTGDEVGPKENRKEAAKEAREKSHRIASIKSERGTRFPLT